ncbi:MAG: transcriptional repressor [Synergistaceae bacterium]|nr:transcriptional repressor [Synergistaceae bacterium]
MSRPRRYNTAQSKAILEYMASLGETHVTAAQIAEYFGKTGSSVGLTTVYRHLDKLTGSGKVRKYFIGGVSCACYQYIASGEDCAGHFHLKCDACGTLVHLRCDMLNEIPEHVYAEHSFLIDRNRVVFYGKCADCLRKD